MAIFKAIISGHATPKKLEDYLKFKENELGEKVPRTNAVSAINADKDDFSESCKDIARHFNTNKKYDSLKYKHYVQGFPPEDCGKMTEEECHRLGVEAAKTLWKDFPVLVVTHYDQEVEGTGEYHWHNHFIVYNCNVTNGRKLNTSGQELWAQKRFIAAQADNYGLTRKGLILENGRIKLSEQEVRVDMAERKIQRRGQAKLDASRADVFLTQKAELRLAIVAAREKTTNYEDFKAYLDKVYNIKTKESRGALGFLHPERSGQNRAWIRGKALGEAFTKEAIINGFEGQYDRRGHIKLDTEEERIEYYKRLFREIFSSNSPYGTERSELYGKYAEQADVAEGGAETTERTDVAGVNVASEDYGIDGTAQAEGAIGQGNTGSDRGADSESRRLVDKARGMLDGGNLKSGGRGGTHL